MAINTNLKPVTNPGKYAAKQVECDPYLKTEKVSNEAGAVCMQQKINVVVNIATTTPRPTQKPTPAPTQKPTPAPTQKPTPKKVCNQNPTGQVYETLLKKGSTFPGHQKVLEWDYYAIHVQQDISKAVGNRMYLMKAFVEIPTAGTYLFDFFSDDDHEVYLNCTMFSQGPFGYYAKNATLAAGTAEFIFRYKNIPNLTHGYIAFNIWSGATMVYQSRASHYKGQENVIGEINWTDE